MTVWCPYCKYKAIRGFYQNRCPQCGRQISNEDALKSDPYKPAFSKKEQREKPKKFVFDQKHGSDVSDGGSGALKGSVLNPNEYL